MQTKEEIYDQVLTHKKKFFPDDINPQWHLVALDYIGQYEGDYPFLVDIQKKIADPTYGLSDAQVAGVLNSAQREAKISKTQTKADDVKLEYVEKGEITSLDDIMSRMKALESNINQLMGSGLPAELSAIVKGANSEENRILEEAREAIKKVRRNRDKAQLELNKFNKDLEEIRRELDYLKEKESEWLKTKAAEEKFEEIRGTVEEIAKGYYWADKLRPYQWDDILHVVLAFLGGNSGVLNANDMGLGKTLETIAVLDILDHLFHDEHGRKPLVLWLTKKSLVGTTFKQFNNWSPARKVVKLTKVPDVKMRETMVAMSIASNATLITNYDALNTTPLLKSTQWDVIVMDEVHKVKGGANHKPTAIFTNTKDVTKRAKFMLPLSGSPIVNHPKEMWCYLNIFDEYKFPTPKDFEDRFCFGYGMKDEEGKPLFQVDWSKLIFGALKDRVIRKSKLEVELELPDKEREFRYLEMEGEQLVHYQNLRKDFFTWLDGEKTKALTATSILAQLTRLRQCAIYPGGIKLRDPIGGLDTVLDCNESAKLDEALDIIEQLLEANEQVIVFSSQFNDPLYELQRRITKNFDVTCETITGSNSADLELFENRFQQGETKVLLINMKTGSEGLNLHKSPNDWPGGASHAIFLDLWWTPALNLQGEDRIWRPGQTDKVIIHILQCEDSVDQFIMGILEQKEGMISGIMESDAIRTGADWRSLLETVL